MIRKRQRYRRVSALALAFARCRKHRRGPVLRLAFPIGPRKIIKVRKNAILSAGSATPVTNDGVMCFDATGAAHKVLKNTAAIANDGSSSQVASLHISASEDSTSRDLTPEELAPESSHVSHDVPLDGQNQLSSVSGTEGSALMAEEPSGPTIWGKQIQSDYQRKRYGFATLTLDSPAIHSFAKR